MNESPQNLGHILAMDSKLTRSLQQSACMLLTMQPNDIGDRLEPAGWRGMIEAPLQVSVSQKHYSKPLFDRFDRLNAKVTQTQQLLDVEVIYLDRPTL